MVKEREQGRGGGDVWWRTVGLEARVQVEGLVVGLGARVPGGVRYIRGR